MRGWCAGVWDAGMWGICGAELESLMNDGAHLARAARHLLAVGPRGEGGAAAHVLEDHLEELFLLVLVVVVDRQRHVLRRLVVACGVRDAAWDAGVVVVGGEVCERRRQLSPKTSVPVDDL